MKLAGVERTYSTEQNSRIFGDKLRCVVCPGATISFRKLKEIDVFDAIHGHALLYDASSIPSFFS